MSTLTPDSPHSSSRDVVPIQRALLSVSDKTGLIELAAALDAAGVEMVSTGSTAAAITRAGFLVTEVSDVTGFPESFDGRVKTLHPAVHAGILADVRVESHRAELAALKIAPFQLVVVNLYPFREAVAAGVPSDDVIEQIDIGGPALVRAAAKNHVNVAIVVRPSSYVNIVEAVRLGGTTFAQRQRLAGEAFAHTAAYDSAVAAWFVSPDSDKEFPVTMCIDAGLTRVLRYGENSHQRAAHYAITGGAGIAQSTQVHGKDLSYNNVVDADAAVRAAFDFSEPAVAIIKHANPCGIAIALPGAQDPITNAFDRAFECDPVSAFGSVIAANRPVTLAMAKAMTTIFTEVLVAPGFDDDALAVLTTKQSIRLLVLPHNYAREALEVKPVSGGFLVQEADEFAEFSSADWQLVSGVEASAATRSDLEFAWKACRAVKSNAILLAHAGASVGIGMGQVNRVDSCHLAVARAGKRATGSVAASDAFFPFADGLTVLLDAGVRAVVQPGGSKRDSEVIAAAHAAGVTMYFTGVRHFSH